MPTTGGSTNPWPPPCHPQDAVEHPEIARLTVNHRFSEKHLIDTTPLPDSIPKVKELGASSAPLQSASFFIGARCKDYNDDFMKCKTENPGKGEFECLKEGRRVTRCARSVYVLHTFRARIKQLRSALHYAGPARDCDRCASGHRDGHSDSCMPHPVVAR